MVFQRFVEIGRVALINYGPDNGKLCVIIDVLDQNRAFIDGPSNINGVQRQVIPLRRLSLTDLKVTIPRSPRLKTLNKAFVEQGIKEKWEATAWAKKLAIRKKRASLTDFDRFNVMLARKEKSRVVRQELRHMATARNRSRTQKAQAAAAAKKAEKQ